MILYELKMENTETDINLQEYCKNVAMILRSSLEFFFNNKENININDFISIYKYLNDNQDINDYILNNEIIMSCIDYGVNVENFIDNIFPDGYEATELFCEYIVKYYEYHHENDDFVFKNYTTSLVPLMKFLLNTDYLNDDQKIYYISNITHKAYISDILCGCDIEEYIENFFDKKLLNTDIHQEILNNVYILYQENKALYVYKNITDYSYSIEGRCQFAKEEIYITNRCCNNNIDYFIKKLNELCFNSTEIEYSLINFINICGAFTQIEHQEQKANLSKKRRNSI